MLIDDVTRPGASWIVVAILVVGFAWAAHSAAQTERPPDPWFSAHAYIATDKCIAVGEEQSLSVGEHVFLFERGRPVTDGRITGITDADSAKLVFDELRFNGVYARPDLWQRFGCWHALRDLDGLFQMAHYEGWPPLGDMEDPPYPLVLDALPDGVLMVGGDGTMLNASELNRLPISFSPNRREYRGSSTLRAATRYRIPGHELIEAHLGHAYYAHGTGGAPIDSIHILTLVFENGRELSAEEWTRVSGQEEHVDVEPPQLDPTNWSQSAIETLGFLGLDHGKTWLRLDRDTGFEGIDWRVWRLRGGEALLLWDRYLYTAH